MSFTSSMDSFSGRVYAACKQIPKGKVSTYKEIAHYLGCRAYRAVGLALNKNPYVDVPCHRVVGSKGDLVGFAHGLETKKRMLESEGVAVEGYTVNLKPYFFKISDK